MYATQIGNGESSEIITKYATAPDTANTNGNVTKIQNGQQGPAITMGVPSVRSHNTNIFPKRRAQQHQKRWKSLTGPCSATSRSHRVETANFFFSSSTAWTWGDRRWWRPILIAFLILLRLLRLRYPNIVCFVVNPSATRVVSNYHKISVKIKRRHCFSSTLVVIYFFLIDSAYNLLPSS